MTRNDFLNDVTEWWELLDFCSDEGCNICEDISTLTSLTSMSRKISATPITHGETFETRFPKSQPDMVTTA